MSDHRTHHITTSDGVSIGGTVHGRGPALVFLQGAAGDGDLDWGRVAEHLADRFTCHLPSLRGHGLSGDHPDLRPDRQADDVVAYVDSLGERTALTGWSGGANMALTVAARSDAVRAVAPFEPAIMPLMDEQMQAVAENSMADTGRLAAEGRMTDALRAFLAFPFYDEEIAVADEVGFVEGAGRYVPNLLNFVQHLMASGDPSFDPAVLGAVSVPVTVVIGADTKPFFVDSARYVAEHIPDARIQEIPGVAHAAPLTHPEALAQAFTGILESHTQPT